MDSTYCGQLVLQHSDHLDFRFGKLWNNWIKCEPKPHLTRYWYAKSKSVVVVALIRVSFSTLEGWPVWNVDEWTHRAFVSVGQHHVDGDGPGAAQLVRPFANGRLAGGAAFGAGASVDRRPKLGLDERRHARHQRQASRNAPAQVLGLGHQAAEHVVFAHCSIRDDPSRWMAIVRFRGRQRPNVRVLASATRRVWGRSRAERGHHGAIVRLPDGPGGSKSPIVTRRVSKVPAPIASRPWPARRIAATVPTTPTSATTRRLSAPYPRWGHHHWTHRTDPMRNKPNRNPMATNSHRHTTVFAKERRARTGNQSRTGRRETRANDGLICIRTSPRTRGRGGGKEKERKGKRKKVTGGAREETSAVEDWRRRTDAGNAGAVPSSLLGTETRAPCQPPAAILPSFLYRVSSFCRFTASFLVSTCPSYCSSSWIEIFCHHFQLHPSTF